MTELVLKELDQLKPSGLLLPHLSEWPKCSSSVVFIWEALNVAGKAKFGSDWTGGELHALNWPVSPEKHAAALKQQAERRAKLSTHLNRGKGITKKPQAKYNAHVLARYAHIGRERYQQRLADLQGQWEVNQRSLQRLRDAAAWLHELFREGGIKTFARYVTGGFEPQELRPGEWNLEHSFECRFVPGQYERWFPTQPPRRFPVYIFVDAVGLKKAFPVTPTVDVPAGIDPANLSKYLQLALHVHALGFGPEFKGEKKLVQRALVDAASQFGLVLSNEQEKYLATFLRNEDAQAGRNRKNAAK